MRWNIKRSKLLLALIPILSIVFYVLTADNSSFAEQTFVAFDIYGMISDAASPVEGKTSPRDYGAAENFAIANQVYLDSNCVQSATNGTVTAMGFYKQTVINFRAKRDGEIFNESVSLSAFASVAEQRYFKDKALLYRAGEASGNAVKGWSDSIVELTPSVYRQRYGVVPQEISKYSVTSESVESESFVSENSDGTFTYELVLDADKAQKYSRYEMMTYANVNTTPEYYTCRMVFTINSNWQMVKVETYETYKVALMGGVKCESKLTETYSYDDLPMPERAQPFIDYVPTGISSDISTEKGPADYLSEAFGDYITGGKALALNAKLGIMGETADVTASIDISGGDYRFKLGDEIYAAYKNDCVYLALGQNKYSLSVKDLDAVKDLLPDGMGDFAFDDSTLGELFANHRIEETDTHIHIVMPFKLFGIDFDVDMGLRKTDDGKTAADTINATVGIGSTKVKADVQIIDSADLPAFDGEGFVPLGPVLGAVANTVKMPAYAITGKAEIVTGDTTTEIGLNARIVKAEKGVTAEGKISVGGLNAEIFYANDTVYAKIGNIAVKAATSDFGSMLSEITSLLPEGSANIDLSSILPQLLPADIGINTVLDMLTGISYDGKELSLTVEPENGKPWTVAIGHGDVINSLTLSGINVDNIGVSLTASLSEAAATPVTVDDGAFVNAKDLLEFIPAVKELTAAQSYDIDLNALLSLPSADKPIDLSGNVTVNRSPFALSASLVCGDIAANIVYADGVAYITAGKFALSCTMDDAKALLEKFGISLPSSQEELSALLPADLDIGELLQNVTLGYDKGNLKATLDINGAKIALTLKRTAHGVNAIVSADSESLSATVSANVNCNKEPAAIAPENRDYLPAEKLIAFVDPVINTVKSKSFTFDVSGSLQKDGLSDQFYAYVAIDLTDGLSLSGTFTVSGQTVEFAYAGRTLFINSATNADVALKLNIDDIDGLLGAFSSLPADVKTFLGTISPLLGDLDMTAVTDMIDKLEKAFAEMSGTTPDLNTITDKLTFLLPALDFDGITSLLAGLKVNNGTITLPVVTADGNRYEITATADSESLKSVSLKNLTVAGMTFNADVRIRCGGGNKVDIDADSYLDLAVLADFAPSLSALLNASNYEAAIDGSINTSVISGNISGTVHLTLSPFAAEAKLKFRDKHDISFFYTDDTFYIAVNDIKLSFNADEIQSFRQEIEKYGKNPDNAEAVTLAAAVYDAAEKAGLIESMLGGKTLAQILDVVKFVTASENGGISAGFSVNDLSATLILEPAGLDSLKIAVSGLNYGADVYNSALSLTLSPIAAYTVAVEDAESYVRLSQLETYISPVMNTFAEKCFAINFSGDVLTKKNGDYTTMNGELKLDLTAGLALFVRLDLDGATGKQAVKLYVMEEGAEATGAAGDINETLKNYVAYIDLNGFTAKIDYTSALKMVGEVAEILNLDIPMLDDLLQGVYTPTGTTVFQTMDIAGLNSLRDTLNSLFDTAEDVSGAATGSSGLMGLMGFVTDDMIDSVLSGVSLGINADNGFLNIGIDNGIFDVLNGGIDALVTVGHDGEHLSYVDISNLIANGDTVNFNATFTCSSEFEDAEKIVPPQSVKCDLSYADEFLYTILKTADARQFEIGGTIELKVLGFLSASIDFDVLVKILDDGSTVAAVKMAVPYFMGALTKTDSYIYFANNMLYFIVDEYDSWFGTGYTGSDVFSATVDQFLSDPFTYLFKLIRMSGTVKDLIVNSIADSDISVTLQGVLANIDKIIKVCEMRSDGTFTLTVDLKQLTGSKDFSDLTVSIGTQDNYVTDLSLSTTLVSVVDLSIKNTSLKNLTRGEDGKYNGTGDLHATDFGRSDKKVNNASVNFDNYGLTKSIDALEDDLAAIFPVEAAETFAAKATAKADKAADAAKNARAASGEVEKCEQAVTDATEEYRTAAEKLQSTPEGSFGYERAKARAEYAEIALKRAQSNLADAQDNRVAAAQASARTAQAAYLYAEKAANAAQKSLEREKSVRSYNATGNAAMAAVYAIEAAQDALKAAVEAANATIDATDLHDESLISRAEQIKADAKALIDGISESMKKTAETASIAASSACTYSVSITATAASETEKARADGDWFVAAQKARETLDAINAMKTTSQAATRGADLSGSDTAKAKADECAASVASSSEAAATTAAMAATDAADNISSLGIALADQAAQYAADGALLEAVQKTGESLDYANAALTASEAAAKAVALTEDEELAASAANAAVTASDAAVYIGNNALITANATAEKYAQQLKTANGEGLDAAERTAEQLKSAVLLIDYSTQAKKYADSEHAAVAGKTAEYVVTCAASVLDNYSDAVYNAANANHSTVASAKSTVDGVSTKDNAYDPVKNAANGLISPAAETERIAKLVASLTADANTAYSATLGLLDAEKSATLAESLESALGSDSTGLKGAYTLLVDSAKNLTDAAAYITERAANLSNGFLNINKSKANAAKEAATNATNAANAANKAVSAVQSPLSSLTSLLPRITGISTI